MPKKEDKRVKLKSGYLKVLIEKATKNIGSQQELSRRLGFKGSSIITKYKQDARVPLLTTVKKIAELAKVPFSIVEENIEEVKEKGWWRKECGRKGGTTTFRRYGSKFYRELNKRLQEKYGHEYFKSLGMKTYRRYGREHMKKMASKVGKMLPNLYPEGKKKWGKKGGMIGAERQKPTTQELNIIEENMESGITSFRVHQSIVNNKTFKNFDFVYFLDGKIVLVEEVTDIPPVKNRIYSKVLEVCESKRFLENANIIVPIIFTFNLSKKSTNIIRFPLDAISILLQENILPVFYDINSKERINLIKRFLKGSDGFVIQEYKTKMKKWLRAEVNKRIEQIKKGARGQLKVPMNKEERLLNEKLIEYGFEPEGKYTLVSKYGVVVVDNFVELRNSLILFEVKKVKGRRSFMKAALDLAAKFFVIKRLYDTQAKYVAVIVWDKEVKINSESYQIKLLKKYSDVIIKNTDFDRLKTLKGI